MDAGLGLSPHLYPSFPIAGQQQTGHRGPTDAHWRRGGRIVPPGLDTELIASLVLSACPQTSRIILLGSRSGPGARVDSDYELLIVLGDHSISPVRAATAIRLGLRGLGAAFDILVVTPEEILRTANWHSSVLHTALSQGRVLHEAA